MNLQEKKENSIKFLQVWGNGDLNIIDKLAGDNFTVYYPMFIKPVQNITTYKKILISFKKAFPDAEIKIRSIFGECDNIAIIWDFSGTHKKEIIGIPPNNKKYSWQGITIYKFSDNKIIEELGQEDFLCISKKFLQR